jgi:hypothetical protein
MLEILEILDVCCSDFLKKNDNYVIIFQTDAIIAVYQEL